MISPKSAALIVFGLFMILAGSALTPALAQSKPDAPKTKPASSESAVDARWLERNISKEDRALLEELIGYAPPAFTADLKWISDKAGTAPDGGAPDVGAGADGAGDGGLTWAALAGRVVVIQSWTSATPAGRNWPQRAVQAVAKSNAPASNVAVIALHTPEGAANAEDFLAKRPIEGARAVIDPSGEFCDALGVYKQPVNIVIDRQGEVRYVGLNTNGLAEAVAALAAQPLDLKKQVKTRPEPSQSGTTNGAAAEFPPITGTVDDALDLRGKRAPEFHVARWMNTQTGGRSNATGPNAENKVVVIVFWSTESDPSVASVPQLNALAEKLQDELVIVGLSDEKVIDFEHGLDKKNVKLTEFKYSIALDPAGKMLKQAQITAIPHCLVISRDWIVRWQGSPGALKLQTLEQIIKADAAKAASGGGDDAEAAKRRRWTGGDGVTR